MAGAIDLLAVDDVDVLLECGILHFEIRQLELASRANAGNYKTIEVQGFSGRHSILQKSIQCVAAISPLNFA